MSELSVIKELNQFRAQINRLHEKILIEQEKRREEYAATGCTSPSRIRFEELDLSRFRQEMLAVHKTLQSRRHNYDLWPQEAGKARFVAIAGMCELIKEEYTGKFWDLYERIIGWKNDLTVYDWIWDRGFREAGIDMLGDERREFVQTLVMESGIPRHRAADIINFFEIYWRYLRGKDVHGVIETLNTSRTFHQIPRADRERLKGLAATATEFTRAFALAVDRLSRVFECIEGSDEIAGGRIEDWTDHIFRATGINPLTILRGTEQLRKLYDRILGIVTPDKLSRIIAAKPPGTMLTLPNGRTARTDHYDNIQLGLHLIEGAQFTCIPALGLDLSFLEKLPRSELKWRDNAALLRSFSDIIPVMNGSVRTDLVRKLFVNKRDCGNLFYFVKKVASDISLRTADGRVNELIIGRDGFECHPYLHLQRIFRRATYVLSVRVNSIRLAATGMREKDVRFFCDREEGALFEGKTDHWGRAACAERSVLLNSPEPGSVSFTAVDAADEILVFPDSNARIKLPLPDAMLFSPSSGRQIKPRQSGAPFKFGGRRFVLFSALGLPENCLKSENFETESIEIIGGYRVSSFVWKDQSRPGRLRVMIQGKQGTTWAFEKCLHFDMYINRKTAVAPAYVVFSRYQGNRPSDFELVLRPFPDPAILGKLFWNIVVNGSALLKIPLPKCRPVPTDNCSLLVNGTELERMLHPHWDRSSPTNASVEFSLCAMDETLATQRFTVFPSLEVLLPPEGVRDGEKFPIQVALGGNDRRELILKNPLGKSKVKVRLEYCDEKWKLRKKEFNGRLEIDSLETSLEIRAIPPLRAARFGNRVKGRAEPARDILRRELGPYDLLVVTDGQVPPEIIVNKEKEKTVFKCISDGLWCLPLSELPGIIKNENHVSISLARFEKSFLVKYRVALLSIVPDEYIADRKVTGSCSYRGPLDSHIELRLIPVLKGEGTVCTASILLEPEGNEIHDQSFSINLPNNFFYDNIDHYKLTAILVDNPAIDPNGHEYGKKWEIIPESKITQNDFRYLKNKIAELVKLGKPFTAAKYLAVAEKVTPNSEQVWFQKMENVIKHMLLRSSLNRVASKIAEVLKKEYRIEIR